MGGEGSGKPLIEIRLKSEVFLNLLSKQKLSRKDLAEKLNITEQHIGRLVRRESAPSLPLLGEMADILGVEPFIIADGLKPPDEEERTIFLKMAKNHPELERLFDKHPGLLRVLFHIMLSESKS